MSSSGGFSPLPLVDGSVNATPLEVQALFTGGSCEVPNGFRDFYVDIDSAHLHKNLVLQVTLDPIADSDGSKVELLPDALKVFMFESAIPKHRKSRLFSDWTEDGTYSVAVNARNLVVGRHFISVQCSPHLTGDHLPRAYSMFVGLSPSKLSPSVPEYGEICDNELLYHQVDITSETMSPPNSPPSSLRFTVCTPPGPLPC